MEFRNPHPQEKSQIRELWKLCFGDPFSYIDFYMEHGFCQDNTFVCAEGNQLLSMMTLMPASIISNSSSYSGGYIYAVATHPAHQNHGYMKQLEAFTAAQAKKRQFTFLSLVPASPPLFQMYKKSGYQIYSSLSEHSYIQKSDRLPFCTKSNSFCMRSLKKSAFSDLRKQWLKNFSQVLDLTPPVRKYSYQEIEYTGWKILEISDLTNVGYLVYEQKNNNEAFIREIGMSSTFFQCALPSLFSYLNVSIIHVKAAPGWKSGGTAVPYSMIKLLNPECDLSFSEDSYANLMLD